jgi:UDP-glucose 4-epimerase
VNRIIITGGNGFIGRHLVKKLLSYKRHTVVLISNTNNMNDKYLADRKLLQDMPLTFYTADIRNREAISGIFLNERPDICIHLAAKTSVADSIKNPEETMDINVKGTLNVLEACHDSQVNNFVFASSAAVYGNVRELPISENHMLEPLSPYGTSKMLAEQHVSSYNKLKKIQNTISLRIFDVYGGGQPSEADVITNFAARLSKGLSPIIYGDGLQTRDFISIDDVVDGILLSIRAMEEVENNNLSSPVFNIGTGIPTSINQLAQKMIGLFGLDLQPIYEEGKEDRRSIMHSYADITKSKELLHFVAKKGIETGLREIIEPMLLRK